MEAARTLVIFCLLYLLEGDAFQFSPTSAIFQSTAGHVKKCWVNSRPVALNGFLRSTPIIIRGKSFPSIVRMAAKTAVITGSSSGIGLAASKELIGKVSLGCPIAKWM